MSNDLIQYKPLPPALATFASSPTLRQAQPGTDAALQAFAELSAACALHLPAENTTEEHFSEILNVLLVAFPDFRVSEIRPALVAYSAGQLGIDPIETYGKPLKPSQIRPIFEAYRKKHFEKSKQLEAYTPKPTAEEEMAAAIAALNAERQLQFEGWLSGAIPLPEKWGELIATDCKAVIEGNHDLFAPHKEAAYARAKNMTSTEIVEAHYGWLLLDSWNLERRYWLRTYGQDPKTPVDADPVPTPVVYAVYAKLCVWEVIKPAPAQIVAPVEIEAVGQEGGQHGS